MAPVSRLSPVQFSPAASPSAVMACRQGVQAPLLSDSSRPRKSIEIDRNFLQASTSDTLPNWAGLGDDNILSHTSHTSESLASFETLAEREGSDLEIDMEIDMWGIHAMSHFWYDPHELIATSAFKTVWRGTRRRDGQNVAVKTMSCKEDDARKAARDEYALLSSLKHQSIITPEVFFESPLECVLCMEWCHDGNLDSYVRERGSLPESQANSLSEQLVQGVAYLHRKRIIHLNLKPTSCLLKQNAAVLKISNFSAAQIRDETGLPSTCLEFQRCRPQCPHMCAAPEAIFDGLCEEPADIWACGVICYFMQKAVMPFDIFHVAEDRTMLDKLIGRICWQGISDTFQSLVQRCLVVDSSCRPSAKELLASSFFRPCICCAASTYRFAGEPSDSGVSDTD
eukprot:gnl/TRDRNA2_/TRDRNA2_188332_c0_seq1.p1 gnl/TRDRNA2_/TRDRNA2_188332_c0~~gnl/TRDRNA2_/TRDRNA2_188332_c0_seq1.p1  ORF type:complete len:398 (-),score=45.90 gnl/TRDRNA2_/TRDRNA2_188332_c0_seq1:431-1624(-)